MRFPMGLLSMPVRKMNSHIVKSECAFSAFTTASAL